MDPLKRKPAIRQRNGTWYLSINRHDVVCASWDDAMFASSDVARWGEGLFTGD